ncbi:MAG: transglycosylase SLT domain-containing protein [Solidesulfovibrio sp. DCME]|uniref:lytic transglycosylase domain-containing protein n=1 Tax=Solidesulfovibrio sp. DCME TaxID=3447380 RepID=UPI003D0D9F1C
MSAFFSITPSQIEQLVGEAATRHGLPVPIVGAVVEHESMGGNVWAYNPEPKYRWFWDVRAGRAFRAVSGLEAACKIPPADFKAYPGVCADAEWWGQQASWGLMQLMGAVARERGFTGLFLGEIYDPALNVDLGCKHLAAYARSYLKGFGWEGVLRAYNGGPAACLKNSNPEYPEKIRKIMGGRLPDA